MKWWTLWAGHVWLLLAIGFLGAATWCIGLGFSEDIAYPEAAMLGIVGLVCVVAAPVCGVVAAHLWKNKYERWYIRNQERLGITVGAARTDWMSLAGIDSHDEQLVRRDGAQRQGGAHRAK